MRKLIFIILGISSIINSAKGCDCLTPSTAIEAERNSKLVFIGAVKEILLESKLYGSNGKQLTLINFEILKHRKGIRNDAMFTSIVNEGWDCDFQFKENQTYLVFASKYGEKSLTTHICSRTKNIEDATEDLENLGDGWKKPKTSDKAYNTPKGESKSNLNTFSVVLNLVLVAIIFALIIRNTAPNKT